jgi:hypothetical protein
VHLAATILAAMTLASPFGSAEASALSVDPGGLTVEVSVTVAGVPAAVLVRPFSSYEELAPTALVLDADGVWRGYVVVPTSENWSIVFDAIDPDGHADRSETVTLTDLGVDPAVVSGPPAAPTGGGGLDAGRLWLFGGIVLALAALGAIAWWTFAPPPGPDAPVDPEPDPEGGTDVLGRPVADAEDPVPPQDTSGAT